MPSSPGQFPLEGLRVLDLTRVLAGPVCTQLLADLGADVVKIERPGLGDDTRQWGPPFAADGGPSGYFLSVNRGKRSLAVDLHHPAGKQVVRDLLAKADCMVENFRRDSLVRLGLEPEQIQTINPDLVACSISSYGRTGPLADEPGYDLVVQAGTGIMSITGEPDGMPMKVGVAITDVVTGLYAAISVLSGLYARTQGQSGRAFDVALTDCTLASLVNVVQGVLLTGQRPVRFGNAHPQIVPYEAFATSDGHLVLAVGTDAQWQRFCKAVGRDDWAADARFGTNPLRVEHRDTLVPRLQTLFRERSTAEWLALLTAADVPQGPVRPIDEVLESPQVAAREMVLEARDATGRRYRLLGGAVHWSDEPSRQVQAPPEVGQHTDEVLAEWLGYGTEEVARLRNVGAVA